MLAVPNASGVSARVEAEARRIEAEIRHFSPFFAIAAPTAAWLRIFQTHLQRGVSELFALWAVL